MAEKLVDFSKFDTSDHALLREYLIGNADAFGCLFEKHRSQLTATALGYLRDIDDAEDMVQNCFCSAMRGASGFRFESDVGTWLYAILIHACIDLLKARKRFSTISSLQSLIDSQTYLDPCFTLEMRSDLKIAIEKLPIEQRRVIFITEIQGLSTKDAALILGCPMGTIKSRRSRALDKIREQVQFVE